jgi:hypothetical protein
VSLFLLGVHKLLSLKMLFYLIFKEGGKHFILNSLNLLKEKYYVYCIGHLNFILKCVALVGDWVGDYQVIATLNLSVLGRVCAPVHVESANEKIHSGCFSFSSAPFVLLLYRDYRLHGQQQKVSFSFCCWPICT